MTRLLRKPNSYDALKIIAVLTMIIDHYGAYISGNLWYRVIGRMAFPLFLFLVGYNKSTKVGARLLIAVGMVSLIDYYYRGEIAALNILGSIALTRWFFRQKASLNHLEIQIGALAWLPTRFLVHYGTMNLLMAELGRRTRARQKPLNLGLALFLFYGITQAWLLKFNFYQSLLLSVLLAGLALYLPFFTIKPINIPKPLLLISHYSLEIYVIHLFIFKIVL